MSTYGADSGTTLDADTLARLLTPRPSRTPPRTRCLGHLLRDPDPRRRPATGATRPAALEHALEAGADVEDLDLLAHLGNTALHLGDDEAPSASYTAMVAGARDAGAGMLVLYALPRLGFTQLAHRPVDRAAQLRRRGALAQRAAPGSQRSPPHRWAG